MKKSNWLFLILFLLLVVLASFLDNENLSNIFDKFKRKERLTLITNDNSPQVIIDQEIFWVEVVTTPAEQRQGLSGRQSLGANRGMLFIFDQAKILTFWMKDMNFDVDLLWLNGDQVVSWEKNMLAPLPGTPDTELLQFSSPVEVDRVLELPSGTIDRLQLRPGDRIVYKNI